MGNIFKTPTQQALDGKKAGTWTMSEPMQGFKKINCECQGGQERNNYLKFIAYVTVPIGSKVTRPYTSSERVLVSDKLRADSFKVDEIKAYKKQRDFLFSGTNEQYGTWALFPQCRPVNCHSMHDEQFPYEQNKSYKPNSFNDNVEKECTNGLYFFIKETKALDY